MDDERNITCICGNAGSYPHDDKQSQKEINNCHMDRCVEMWFDGPEEWYHCAVENAASFKKPEWAEYDNFPYLRPQFQFASLFLTDIATSDNLKQYRGYLPMR